MRRSTYIGHIRTPWKRREDCPKNPRESDATCVIAVDPRWTKALQGLETVSHVVVLYWMDRARRDLVLQAPHHYSERRGTFALRSPVRPNPIAVSVARIVRIEGCTLTVVGLDCVDNTPLLDLKPYFASTNSVPDAAVGWHAGLKALSIKTAAALRRPAPCRGKSSRRRSAAATLSPAYLSTSVGWPIFLRLSIRLAFARVAKRAA